MSEVREDSTNAPTPVWVGRKNRSWRFYISQSMPFDKNEHASGIEVYRSAPVGGVRRKRKMGHMLVGDIHP